MELHPRLDLTDLPLKQQKIILGSFPVWSHTISEPSNITEEIDKKKNRLERGDIDFFFLEVQKIISGSGIDHLLIWVFKLEILTVLKEV